MKTLYININNEQIQSNEELEVLKHDLDSDFFFYLGEKIAKGCNVDNENAIITDFKTQDNEEEYKQIIAQWNEIKAILFSEEYEREFELRLPNGYIHWLRYSEKYNHVYDKNFSHGEPLVIYIDLKELYEESVEDLQRKMLRKLQRDDLYLEIDEIVFNDDAVTRKSSIVRTIKDKYEGVSFKAYKKWLEGNKPQEGNNIPDIGIPITEEEDYSSDNLTLLVNWICDEFEKERTIDCRRDEKMMSKIYDITKNALNEYEASWIKHSVDIYIPYVAKYDSNGNPIHTTNFKRTLSKGLLHSLKHPNEVEDESWGWEYVNYLDCGLILKRHNFKYGLVDYEGIIIAQCEYNEIMQLKSGNIRLQKKGKYGLINKDKTINLPCIYDEIYDSGDNLFRVKIGNDFYKIDGNGVKKYIKDGRGWIYMDRDGTICQESWCVMQFFPICGVVLGYTNISQFDKCVSSGEITVDDRGIKTTCKIYNVHSYDKIFFIQFDTDEYISIAQLLSSSEEYNKIVSKLKHLNYAPIWKNDFGSIYQTPDQSLKILVQSDVIIIQHYSASYKFIDVFLREVAQKKYGNS